jgi:hypothetical protein
MEMPLSQKKTKTTKNRFNAPPSMTEDRVRKLFEDGCAKGAQLPGKITVFNTHSTRSTSGLMEFDSVEV